MEALKSLIDLKEHYLHLWHVIKLMQPLLRFYFGSCREDFSITKVVKCFFFKSVWVLLGFWRLVLRQNDHDNNHELIFTFGSTFSSNQMKITLFIYQKFQVCKSISVFTTLTGQTTKRKSSKYTNTSTVKCSQKYMNKRYDIDLTVKIASCEPITTTTH